ncbi:MAG: hypothetical protein GQ542_18865 [Desulforhopalus sp.]|nr:hypothetical protein [Desulforhopalus sp.]
MSIFAVFRVGNSGLDDRDIVAQIIRALPVDRELGACDHFGESLHPACNAANINGCYS